MSVQQQPEAAAAEKGSPTAQSKAQDKDKERELAQEKMRELEAGDAPTKIEDWPSGPEKFLTYGNEDEESYGTGVTAKIGPPDLRRYPDGSVSIGGEKVDNPDDYKGEPLPGGPTDPDSVTSVQADDAKKDTGTAQSKAQDKDGEHEHAQEEMRELEAGDAPTKIEDWPSGPAKFLTYGIDDEESYGAGVTAKLGPPDLRRYADGSVSIGGETVDNPDDYKGEPLPGGPTDPDAPSQ